MSATTSPIAIIGAMDAEIQEYLHHLEDMKEEAWNHFVFYHGLLEGKNVVLVKSGIGKVFSAMIAQHMIDTYAPSHLLFTGVAGALNTAYEIGDIVLSKDCIQHDMDVRALGFERGRIPYTDFKVFEANNELLAIAQGVQSEQRIHTGRILTGDQFFTHSALDSHTYLTQELEGDAIEMEGAAVGQVCSLNNIPFLVVRTISDKANEEASLNFNEFLPKVAKNSFAVVRHTLKNL